MKPKGHFEINWPLLCSPLLLSPCLRQNKGRSRVKSQALVKFSIALVHLSFFVVNCKRFTNALILEVLDCLNCHMYSPIAHWGITGHHVDINLTLFWQFLIQTNVQKILFINIQYHECAWLLSFVIVTNYKL